MEEIGLVPDLWTVNNIWQLAIPQITLSPAASQPRSEVDDKPLKTF